MLEFAKRNLGIYAMQEDAIENKTADQNLEARVAQIEEATDIEGMTALVALMTQTKEEIEALLEQGGFAPTSHTHTVQNITDFPSIPTTVAALTDSADYVKVTTLGSPATETTAATGIYSYIAALEARILALETNSPTPSEPSDEPSDTPSTLGYYGVFAGDDTAAMKAAILASEAAAYTLITSDEMTVTAEDTGAIVVLSNSETAPKVSIYDANLDQWGDLVTLVEGKASTGTAKTIGSTEYKLWYTITATVSEIGDTFKIKL